MQHSQNRCIRFSSFFKWSLQCFKFISIIILTKFIYNTVVFCFPRQLLHSFLVWQYLLVHSDPSLPFAVFFLHIHFFLLSTLLQLHIITCNIWKLITKKTMVCLTTSKSKADIEGGSAINSKSGGGSFGVVASRTADRSNSCCFCCCTWEGVCRGVLPTPGAEASLSPAQKIMNSYQWQLSISCVNYNAKYW